MITNSDICLFGRGVNQNLHMSQSSKNNNQYHCNYQYNCHNNSYNNDCNCDSKHRHSCSCHIEHKHNHKMDLQFLSNWSRAMNLLQINLNKIMKVYESNCYDMFVHDLIQIPNVKEGDNFYLFVYRIDFDNLKKTRVIFHPLKSIGKTISQLDKCNGNRYESRAIIKMIKKLDQDRIPLNLTNIKYNWYGKINNAIVVLYKPLKCINKFDKKAPYYMLGCGYDD